MKMLTAQYRHAYNRIRSYSSPGYRTPAPETVLPVGPLPALVPPTGLLVQEMWAGRNQR